MTTGYFVDISGLYSATKQKFNARPNYQAILEYLDLPEGSTLHAYSNRQDVKPKFVDSLKIMGFHYTPGYRDRYLVSMSVDSLLAASRTVKHAIFTASDPRMIPVFRALRASGVSVTLAVVDVHSALLREVDNLLYIESRHCLEAHYPT